MSRNEIVTESDLVSAVEDALRRRHVYNKIKAQIRAEVFHVLEDKTVSPPEQPADIFLIGELIKEFCIKMKLENTLSVFCEELGHRNEVMGVDRTFLGAELGLNTIGSEESIPLLVLMTQYLKRNREEYIKSAIGQMDLASTASTASVASSSIAGSSSSSTASSSSQARNSGIPQHTGIPVRSHASVSSSHTNGSEAKDNNEARNTQASVASQVTELSQDDNNSYANDGFEENSMLRY